jgi:hypothetical protein
MGSKSEPKARFSVLFSHGPNKAFLVPDSCRVNERNSNSRSADITDDANENY